MPTFSFVTRNYGLDGQIGSTPSKGSKLSVQEMDYNLLYLNQLAQSGGSGTFSGGISDITYNDLVGLIDEDGLTQGAFYKITDFRSCYDMPDYDYNG